MAAIRHRMAANGPDCAKMRLTFHCFFHLSSCFQTENLLWPDCQSRFFYRLKGVPRNSGHTLQPVEKGHLSVVFFSYKERECGIMVWGCASSVQVIQSGERPDPAKRSEQPVLSLGAGAAR